MVDERRQCAVFVESVEKKELNSVIHYIWRGEEGEYTLPFIDEASVRNSVTTAVVVALHLGALKDSSGQNECRTLSP